MGCGLVICASETHKTVMAVCIVVVPPVSDCQLVSASHRVQDCQIFGEQRRRMVVWRTQTGKLFLYRTKRGKGVKNCLVYNVGKIGSKQGTIWGKWRGTRGEGGWG